MAPTSDAPFRILYVEDDDDIRELLANHLRNLGYDVTEADSAETGLELLEAAPFGLVLSDYHLPEHTGTWMLGEASARGVLGDACVILLTAAVRIEGGEGVQRIQKPVDLATLDQAVSAARDAHADGAGEEREAAAAGHVELVLYVHAGTQSAQRTRSNLMRVLRGYDTERVRIRWIDVSTSEGAELAAENAVSFVPMLVRVAPGREHRLVGDLRRRSALERLLRDAGVERT